MCKFNVHHSVSLPLKCKNIQNYCVLIELRVLPRWRRILKVRTSTCKLRMDGEDDYQGRIGWSGQINLDHLINMFKVLFLKSPKNRFFESSHFRISKMCHGLKFKSEQTTKSAGRGIRGYDRVFAVDRSPRLSINELFPSQYSRDKTSI